MVMRVEEVKVLEHKDDKPLKMDSWEWYHFRNPSSSKQATHDDMQERFYSSNLGEPFENSEEKEIKKLLIDYEKYGNTIDIDGVDFNVATIKLSPNRKKEYVKLYKFLRKKRLIAMLLEVPEGEIELSESEMESLLMSLVSLSCGTWKTKPPLKIAAKEACKRYKNLGDVML